ncbi:hypothetical protein [Acetobacter oryzoeni]|uniref:Uncharacterized protein n=1 Tax=Acetobacter oryzoeni TaxID=2500548 RepID=A0A5B9GHY1_9PROT|nr:hypothetical protein [Acetobacter oryzoeni]MCP1202192.1 hypothetical protein [Acetobacter oryzoeni]QEE85898.1 hypothetical protein EOV40_009360 [Acetobacter oryzoeni]
MFFRHPCEPKPERPPVPFPVFPLPVQNSIDASYNLRDISLMGILISEHEWKMIQFDIRQLAQASGMTEANIVMLMNRMPELFPEDQVAKGHGKKRLVSVNGLRRIAFVGAIASIGIGPTQAAKFVITFLENVALRGWAKAIIDPMPWPEHRKEADRLLLDANLIKLPHYKDIICKETNDIGIDELNFKSSDDITFNCVMSIMENGDEWDLYKAGKGDVILTIINGDYVAVNRLEEDELIFAFQIRGWERGADLIFKDIFKNKDKEDIQAELSVIENASVKIVINLSATTRIAFMRSVL